VAALRRNTLRALLLTASTALLVLAGFATSEYRKATAFGPLFVDPFSLAVDEAGNLYCGVEFERVHKYSPDRRMIGAWSVDAGLRPFRLRVAAGPSIEAATAAGKLIRFSDTGKTLSNEEDPGAFERFGAANDSQVETPSGVRYTIADNAIVRSEKGATTVWLPAASWSLRWVRTPAPMAVLLILGPVGLIASVVIPSSSRAEVESRGAPE
jgi:hypothetical protein